jgi:type I site-specific restriction endonuclease
LDEVDDLLSGKVEEWSDQSRSLKSPTDDGMASRRSKPGGDRDSGGWLRYFEEFIVHRQFNANQIRFLRAVQNMFLKNRRLEVADLYEEPLDRFGEDALERWFSVVRRKWAN